MQMCGMKPAHGLPKDQKTGGAHIPLAPPTCRTLAALPDAQNRVARRRGQGGGAVAGEAVSPWVWKAGLGWVPGAVRGARPRKYTGAAGGHVRIYPRSALRTMLAAHGYRIVASHFAHALHSPFWWLRCLVGVENERRWLVVLYHRFLVWDLMKKPLVTRLLDRLLNPFIGKSVVFYAEKG